jgi:transcriptional regulator with XRE-family HTH domain
MDALSDRVRLRLRHEMAQKRLSQRDIAGILNWSQSRVAHLLTGRVAMTVDDLNHLAFAVSLSPLELVRDQGLEFVADLTPSELRAVQALRAKPEKERDAFFTVLQVSPRDDTRRAAKPTKPRARRFA